MINARQLRRGLAPFPGRGDGRYIPEGNRSRLARGRKETAFVFRFFFRAYFPSSFVIISVHNKRFAFFLVVEGRKKANLFSIRIAGDYRIAMSYQPSMLWGPQQQVHGQTYTAYPSGDRDGYGSQVWGAVLGCLIVSATLGISIAILVIVTTGTVECNLAPLVTEQSAKDRNNNIALGMRVMRDLHCGCVSPHCPPGIAQKAEGVNKICNCTMGGLAEDVLLECVCPHIEEVCGNPGPSAGPSVCGIPSRVCSGGDPTVPPGTNIPPATEPPPPPPPPQATGGLPPP